MPAASAPNRIDEPVLPGPEAAMLRRQWRRLGRRIAAGRYAVDAGAISAAIVERERGEQPQDSARPAPAAVASLLDEAIARLPSIYALILQLALVEQLSDPAIGEVAGWPAPRVARLRRTALRLLAQRLRRLFPTG